MAAGKTFLAILDSEKPRADDLLKLSQMAGAYPTMADSRIVIEKHEESPLDIALRGLIAALLESPVINGDVVAGELVAEKTTEN